MYCMSGDRPRGRDSFQHGSKRVDVLCRPVKNVESVNPFLRSISCLQIDKKQRRSLSTGSLCTRSKRQQWRIKGIMRGMYPHQYTVLLPVKKYGRNFKIRDIIMRQKPKQASTASLVLFRKYCVTFASQRVSLIVIPFCLSVCLSVIPRPTAYHD